MLTAKIEKGDLVLRIPLQTPQPSGSGKTLIVASTHGNKTVNLDLGKGPQEVRIGLNAYVSK
jgi:hypothetical protein